MSKAKDRIKEFQVPDDVLQKELADAMKDVGDSLEAFYEKSIRNFEVGSILKGRIIRAMGDDILVDVGYKSEGVVAAREFRGEEETVPGTIIEVLLESIEDEEGIMLLSKRRADRIRGWERIIETHKEGDVVTGVVTRKIKGGLLVDIGVPVFLPASQVNIRRPGDIAEYIGREIQAKILKIDENKRNIVIFMQELEMGQIRKGVVKNIADFGAFVDLGGLDGLLHITDMSWSRIGHPSEIVKIDEEIEVMIIGIDREREKIALGLKQKSASPWTGVEDRYPLGSRHAGEVVNIVSYGAFVKLEDGIEGLVHISEMSWTRRINHPSEVLAIGDEVDIVVLGINPDKQEISLGVKQTEVNPWMLVEERYPAGTVIEGTIRNLTNYGAFIEIEEGIDGLLHVSDMSWTKKINHPADVLEKGQTIRTVVLSVDQEKKRVSLGTKQLSEDPWLHDIPSRYCVGDVVTGKVTKITNFGVFVELEGDLEGLLHVSELADHKIEAPQEIVRIGDEIEVKILRVDIEDRKIGLSLKQAPGEGIPIVSAAADAQATETASPEEQAADETPDADVPVLEEADNDASPGEKPPADTQKDTLPETTPETPGDSSPQTEENREEKAE